MIKERKLLSQVTEGMVEGQEVLTKEKKKLKKATDRIAKDNEKRALKVMKEAVENLEDHRQLLKEQLSSKAE